MHRTALALIGSLALSLGGAPPAGGHPPAGSPAGRPDASPAIAIPGLPDNVPPAALRSEPLLPVPAGWPFPDVFPRTSGTGRLVAGALEWSDFLYDDHGATGTAVAPPVTPLAPAYGTYAYPPGAARDNGADIFRAAVGLDDDATYWRVDWNTLVDPRLPIAEFAIDTDRSASTGAVGWTAGAGIRSPGSEQTIVLSSRRALLINPVTGRQTTLSSGLFVDRFARSFILRIPRSTLEPAGTWRVRLAAGLANVTGDGFATVSPDQGALPGQPAVFNVAFRSHLQERPVGGQPTNAPLPNFWREAAQAAALTAGDVSAFAVDVSWDDLARGRTTPEPAPVGFSDRWYVSSLELGQGVVSDNASQEGGLVDVRPNYLGRIQPYAVYVPTSYDGTRPAPLTWMLHSLFQQHNAFGVRTPRFVQQACEARRSICVTPLGRGHDGFYLDEAEVDFWEVWNRLAITYRLDPQRTELAGFSMGGYAAYRLGFAHPDLFAHATVLAGTPVCGQRFAPGVEAPFAPGRCTTDGDTTPLVENARGLPYYVAHGTADELLPFTGTVEQVDRFDRLGYRYRFEHYLGQAHIPWYLQDTWVSAALQMGSAPRTVDPSHVTYRWHPNLDRPQWGLQTMGAYWIRDVAARESGPRSWARIDARSQARPDPGTIPVRRRSVLVAEESSPAAVSELTWSLAKPALPQPSIAFDLRNVAALRVDLGEAGLAPGEAATLALRSDGESVLTLTGARPGTTIELDRVAMGSAGPDGRFTVRVPPGKSEVALRPWTGREKNTLVRGLERRDGRSGGDS